MAIGRPFQKGQSGNPSGRPKGFKGLGNYIRQETRNGREIVKFALRVLRGEEKNPHVTKDGDVIEVEAHVRDKAWAAEFLTDRAFGKPPNFTQLPSDDEDEVEGIDPKLLMLLKPPTRAEGGE